METDCCEGVFKRDYLNRLETLPLLKSIQHEAIKHVNTSEVKAVYIVAHVNAEQIQADFEWEEISN